MVAGASGSAGAKESVGMKYVPPIEAAYAAAEALRVRASKPRSQRGMTAVGMARARQLVARQPLSEDVVRRMWSYFRRHAIDKHGSTWTSYGRGRQAWNGWGGDPAYRWLAVEVMPSLHGARKENSARSPFVEGTTVSSVRLYWPDGRMRPMPGDRVYAIVPGLYGVSIAHGVAVQRAAAVRIVAQGRNHPASSLWTVQGDPHVADATQREALSKRTTESARQHAQLEAANAVAEYADGLNLRPVASLAEVKAGDVLHSIRSAGRFGDGDPHELLHQQVVVSAVDGTTFWYEDATSERCAGDVSGWWCKRRPSRPDDRTFRLAQ